MTHVRGAPFHPQTQGKIKRWHVTDLCGIALLFGRTMEGLSGTLFAEHAREMQDRLFDLPEARTKWLGHFNRSNALERLSDRIERIIEAHGS